MPETESLTAESLNVFLATVRAELDSYKRFMEIHAPQLAPGFNMVSCFNPNENKLSAVIAMLLDPNGGHGQGSLFLSAFLNKLKEGFDDKTVAILKAHFGVEQINKYKEALENKLKNKLIDAELKRITEKPRCEVATSNIANSQRRIDILIHFNTKETKGFGIAIENKPSAPDQDDQLKEYNDHLFKQYGKDNYLQIYLSGSGNLPEENSITSNEWNDLACDGCLTLMTYSQLKEWACLCAEKCKAPRLRYFIEDLAEYIRDEFEGGLPDMEKELIIEQSAKKENINAAFAIGSTWPETMQHLIKKLAELVKQSLEVTSGSWEVEPDFNYYGTDSGFSLYRKGLWSRYRIKCIFEQTSARLFFCGISKTSSQEPDDYDKQLAKKMDEEFTEKEYPNFNWVWWEYFDAPYDNWSNSSVPWAGIYENGETVNIVTAMVKRAIDCVGSDIDEIEKLLLAKSTAA